MKSVTVRWYATPQSYNLLPEKHSILNLPVRFVIVVPRFVHIVCPRVMPYEKVKRFVHTE
jgi:hypothetical protein